MRAERVLPEMRARIEGFWLGRLLDRPRGLSRLC
jgi:hypothetical protein